MNLQDETQRQPELKGISDPITPEEKTFAEEYAAELEELTFNSKPIINNLTMIAGENLKSSKAVVKIVESKIQRAACDKILPILYLLDSIVKNIGGQYIHIFSANIVETFCNTYERVDDNTRISLIRLLQTWPPVFGQGIVDAIQTRTSTFSASRKTQPAPKKLSAPAGAIHVNPDFIKRGARSSIDERAREEEKLERAMNSRISPRIPEKSDDRRNDEVLARAVNIRAGARPVGVGVGPNKRAENIPKGILNKNAPLNNIPALSFNSLQRMSNPSSSTPSASQAPVRSSAKKPGLPLKNKSPVDFEERSMKEPRRSSRETIINPNDRMGNNNAEFMYSDGAGMGAIGNMSSGMGGDGGGMGGGWSPRRLGGEVQDFGGMNFQRTPNGLQHTHSRLHHSAPQHHQMQHPHHFNSDENFARTPHIHHSQLPQNSANLSSYNDLQSNSNLSGGMETGDFHSHINQPSPMMEVSSQLLHPSAPHQHSLGNAPLRPPTPPTAGPFIPPRHPHGTVSSSLSGLEPKHGFVDFSKLDFSGDNIKNRRYEPVINSLYFDFPLQCKTCGYRFHDREKMGKHLDWHFRMNRREKQKVKKAMSRSWYLPLEDWILYETGEVEQPAAPMFDNKSKSAQDEEEEEEEKLPSVPADEEQKSCLICGEQFEQFWDNEVEDWIFKNAIKEESTGNIFHIICYRDSQKSKATEENNYPIDSNNPESNKRTLEPSYEPELKRFKQ